MFDFEDLIEITQVSGYQIVAHCPFHDDNSPSFSANTETGLSTGLVRPRRV